MRDGPSAALVRRRQPRSIAGGIVIDLALPVLVQNAALLLAVAVVFDVVSSRVTIDRARIEQAISGLLLGVIGVSIMLSPWHFASGIFFDTRTVLQIGRASCRESGCGEVGRL